MNIVFDLIQGIVNVVVTIALLSIMQSAPIKHYDINNEKLFTKNKIIKKS